MRLLIAALVLALAACGGGTTSSSTETTPRDTRATVELSVRDPRGGFVHVGDLRGQVVMLVVLTTYDTMCQALLADLQRFAVTHTDVAIVGVLHQPSAEELAGAFVTALDPVFPIGFDPDGVIASGTSPLGTITTVPTIVTLDRAGHVVARREGYQSERVLEAMVLDADVRVPAGAVAPPPLLGTPSPR